MALDNGVHLNPSGCASGYYNDSGTCRLTCTDAHCNSCDTTGNAGECDPTGCASGYYNDSGTCRLTCTDSHCTSCDTTGYAGECDPMGCASGYYNDAGTCRLTCADSHCTSCDQTGDPASCDPSGCASGYYNDDGTCRLTCTDSHCQSCDTTGDAGECDPSGCASGYYNDSGTCRLTCSDSHCTSCDETGNATECDPTGCASGYYNDDGTCRLTCTDSHCQSCDTTGDAGECDPSGCASGYYNDSGTCRAIPAAPTSITIPAAIYTGQTVTVSWASSTNATGYILEGKCGSGEYIQLYNGPNLTFDNNITVCATTVQYRVKAYNTQTTIASVYTESASRTVTSCATNCSVCSSTGACTTCEDGYHVNAGTCVGDVGSSSYCQGAGVTGTMQTWTGCSSLAVPTAGAYTQGPCLADERDGKVYQVRKFADGKCWMVENLRYGGTTTASASDDYCKGKTGSYTKGYTDGTKNGGWYGKVGTNATSTGTAGTLYGDCRDPATTNLGPCTTGSTACGYLYNWQAAMQLASAYYGNGSQAVSYPNGTPSTTNYLQGICPAGWHLPSGGTTDSDSEFVKLYMDNGGSGDNNQNGFWEPDSTTSTGSNDWNGLCFGYVGYDGTFYYQGGSGWWWSSSEYSVVGYAYRLYVNTGYAIPQNISSKSYGAAVRCVKN